MSTVAPILNEYKYGLALRRLVQSFTGGVIVQKGLPPCVHVTQWLLWLLPFILSLPFIGGSFAWNEYYLGAIYGVMMGVLLAVLNGTILIINHMTNSHRDGPLIDEDDPVISTCNEAVNFTFTPRHPINVIAHSVVSGLTCFAGFILLDIPVLQTLFPIPVIVFVFPLGWLGMCISHYSLLAHPPHELSAYRSYHQDILQFKFITRSFHVLIAGAVFVILRHLLSFCAVYFYILYAFISLFPLLWFSGCLPPIDSLFFWITEQTLVHLMGGTPGASELRLIVMFVLSVISTVPVAVISDQTISTPLAAGLGFILSLNLLQFCLDLTKLCCRTSQCLSSDICQTDHYWTLCFLTVIKLHTVKQFFLKHLLTTIKTLLLLPVTVAIVYITTSNTASTNVLTAFKAITISLPVITELLRLPNVLYCIGSRFPCYSRNKDFVSSIHSKRKLLLYFSIPNQLLSYYVAPLCLVTYIGLTIGYSTADISSVWFGITTLRLLRKVWQNTSESLKELGIVAILDLALPTDNVWIKLGIGSQSLVVGISISVCRNIYSTVVFYAVLFVSFIGDTKQRTRRYPLSLCLVISLLPLSCASILLSSLLSSPVLPLFTLPFLLALFPRPSSYWPRFIHKSFTSKATEAVLYKQAQKNIVKALSLTLYGGSVVPQPGDFMLIRFQDRTAVVHLLERGYGYWSISLQGLELQETSCHSVEVTRIDDVIDSGYTSNCSSPSYWCNTHPLTLFKLVDINTAKVYSDARNNLSGIIDQREYLNKFSKSLYKILVWMIFRYGSTHDIIMEEPVKSSDRHPVVTKKEETLFLSESLSSMDLASLQRRVFSTSSRHITSHNSTLHPSQVQMHSPLTSNKVTPLSSAAKKLPPFSLPASSEDISAVLHQFPNDWLKFILEHHFKKRNNFTTGQLNNLKTLAAVCFSIADTPTAHAVYSTGTTSTRPTHLLNGFNGNFTVPLNGYAHLQWLRNNPVLFDLVLRSYRYAVKLLYDEAVLGEVTTLSELCDYIVEYEKDWFIGNEDEEEWQAAVVSEKEHLFSIDYDQEKNLYTSHILSLQDEIIHLGMLNSSSIKGIWSNLSWELQYLTNDDEERYSIQAHSKLLRNLITQTANIPLGYYIYQSSLITL